MTLSQNQIVVRQSEPLTERLEMLREENARLTRVNQEAFDYIRDKVNSLLEVIGTKNLRPEELDDQSLIEFDPIGIVARTFQHVLQNLQITNQKLYFAHEQIKAVFETVGAAVLVLDSHGKVVSYNQKTRDLMLGGNFDIRGKKCQEHVCQRDVVDEECMFHCVMRHRREQHLDDWNLKGRVFDVIGRPMFDETGKQITHVVIAYHDVSARRDAQNKLLEALNETQEANDKIRGILRSAADGILVTDADNNIVLINRRAEELIGLSNELPASFTRIDAIPHKELAVLLRRGAQNDEESFSEDMTFQPPGHSPCICQVRMTVIKSSKNAFSGCITILHDVTEQRTIDRMKNEFVSTAAHELRTPLATIIGYTDLMLMKNDFSTEQKTEFLQLIQKKAERLGDIVSDLLDISRIESGEGIQFDAKPHRVDLVCQEIVKNFQLQTPSHNIILDLPSSSDVTVAFDRFAMVQVLENLLSNAVKYSPRGGEIRVSIRLENSTCLVSITDHGLGMTSEQVAKIFDKFYRVDATNTAIPGTGLGMTIVKHLVEAQSGQINITSSIGEGTTVTLALPAVTGSMALESG